MKLCREMAFLALWFCGSAIASSLNERSDEWLEKPVDQQTFETYLEFFEVDPELPFESELLGTSVDDGVRREHWSFESTPGERVFAYVYTLAPARSQERAPTLLFLHGGAVGGKDHPYYTRMCRQITQAGWDVLAIDLGHFGERDDGLLTTFTETDKHERLYNQPSQYLDWVVQSVKDVRRSYDFLVEEKRAAPDRLGILGHSRGAVVALIAGAVEKRLPVVVALHGGHFDAMEREHRAPACPANYVSRIQPRPLLAVNGRNDADFAPKTSIEPLYRHAGEPKRLIWTDGGHGYTTDEDWAAVFAWLREKL